MAYIRTIGPREARGGLAQLYERVGNPDGTVDNVMTIHGLSVDSLRGHFELYVAAMHRPSPLSRVEREIVGTLVSRLNGCAYCVAHHAAGLERLLRGDRPGLTDALRSHGAGRPIEGLTDRERAMVAYAERLTRTPASVTRADVDALRGAGLDDRAILDLAQVVAYFCYANRIVLGLGVELEETGIGQHPRVRGDGRG